MIGIGWLRRATGFALLTMCLTVPSAFAGSTVDPNTLIPPPPPGAECSATGAFVICHTDFVESAVNEPIVDFTLPCGTIYETINDVRRGIRWYDSSDLTIVKRLVFQDAEGSWSLSPTGEGPTVTLTAHANWRNLEFPDPLDESTWPTTFHGNEFTLSAPGFGVIAHVAGLDLPDGTHHGAARVIEDPVVAAELCAALGG
jgi:hypothetical protein